MTARRLSPLLALALIGSLSVGMPPEPRRREEEDPPPRPRYAPTPSRLTANAAPVAYVAPAHRPAPDDAPGFKGRREGSRASRKAARS